MSESQIIHQTSGHEIYAALCNGEIKTQFSSELTVLELLRKAYSDHYITVISRHGWDIKGFTAAGHAQCNIERVEDTYNAIRSYQKESGPQLGQQAGELVDRVRYGRLNLVWQGHKFILYDIDYKMNEFSLPGPRGMRESSLFVLNSHADEVRNESDVTLIDQLMIAIGEWSRGLHDEIFVFDNGEWVKSPELWQNVQESSWDDVILSPDMKANLIADVTGFFDNMDLHKKLSVPWKRGLIFHGVP